MNITIYNENYHERENKEVARIYPKGIHSAIGEFLAENSCCKNSCKGKLAGHHENKISYATLDMPEHGLTQEVIENTDVLIWWGHMKHEEVSDKIVERVYNQVITKGMGLIVLHSGHFSKIFKKLMGTSCDLKWNVTKGENCRVWKVDPTHPITAGIPDYFDIEQEEMYGEHFDIPTPDELVFVSWFKGGNIFRGGCVYKRGLGKVFYFHPGHEEFPTYYNENVQRVIKNAVKFVKKPRNCIKPTQYGWYKAIEKI